MHDGSGKADFGSIYDREDPREYFRVLGKLDYGIPHHAQSVFSALLKARHEDKGGGEKQDVILDLCCSYGINAVLLKCDLTMNDLYERYCSGEVASLSSEELADSDAGFFARRAKEDAPVVAGLDSSRNAVSYALRAGMLDAGFAENLEDDDPSEDLCETASRADLITVTGGISYITETTFGRLMDCASPERPPWVASFPLRSVSYEKISALLSRHGLVTEKLTGHTFEQRHFTNAEEQERTLKTLEGLGVDPAGREAEGSFHTDLYLSRPANEAAETTVEELLAPFPKVEGDSSG